MEINQVTKEQIWWMLISCEYDYSRITIAEHELDATGLTLWLEDKHDFKNTLGECLQLHISIEDFKQYIKDEQLNTYGTTKVHKKKKFSYKARVEINEPIKWYCEDTTTVEQQWTREGLLKKVLTELVETEIKK